MMLTVLLFAMGLAWFSLTFVVFNSVTLDRLEKMGEASDRGPGDLPRVTLMIPFRNEAQNLKRTLPALRKIQYPGLKILLLNDRSEDIGPFLVQDIALHDPERFELIEGAEKPDGWVGKNWACHQLSQFEEALASQPGSNRKDSDVLLFCDADVEIGPNAVRETVEAMLRTHADALTAFPRQILETWSERAIVPLIMNLSILSLLPLKLLPFFRSPSAVFCNGQWLAFTRAAYGSIKGHSGVRSKVLEDMELGRRLHVKKLKLLPVLASRSLHVRMYQSFAEVREGFGKNLSALTGGHLFGAGFAILWILFAWILALFSPLGFFAILAQRVLLIRMTQVQGRAAIESVLLHGVGSVLSVFLVGYSYFLKVSGKAQWKGRILSRDLS